MWVCVGCCLSVDCCWKKEEGRKERTLARDGQGWCEVAGHGGVPILPFHAPSIRVKSVIANSMGRCDT